MDLQAQIIQAVVEELKRQPAEPSGHLTVSAAGRRAQLSGSVDLEALAMAISGAVAGGP